MWERSLLHHVDLFLGRAEVVIRVRDHLVVLHILRSSLLLLLGCAFSHDTRHVDLVARGHVKQAVVRAVALEGFLEGGDLAGHRLAVRHHQRRSSRPERVFDDHLLALQELALLPVGQCLLPSNRKL